MPVDEERPRSRRPEAIPLIIAVIVWAIIVLLFFFPELGGITDWDFDYWLNIGYLVIFVCLLVAAVSKYTFGPASEGIDEAEDVEAAEAKAAQMAKAPAAKVARPPAATTAKPAAKARTAPKKGAPKAVTVAPDEERPAERVAMASTQVKAPEPTIRIVEWPFKRPGGVYSDTFVPVRRDLVLNVRTELGRVCGNCEELPACKKLVSGRLADDVWEWNFECKEGLKRELGRVRKARLVEAAAKAKEQEQEMPPEPEVAEEVEAEPPGAPEPPEPGIASPPAYKDRKEDAGEKEGEEKGEEEGPSEPVEPGPGAEEAEQAQAQKATEVEPRPATKKGPKESPPAVDETEQDEAIEPEPEVKAKPKVKKKVKRKE